MAEESMPRRATSTPIITGPPVHFTSRPTADSTDCLEIIVSSSATGNSPNTLTR